MKQCEITQSKRFGNMASTDFSQQLRMASHNNTDAEMVLFADSSVLSDCDSPDSIISVRNKSENLRHRLDTERRKTESVDDDDEVGDEEEDDDEEEGDNVDDDDGDHEGANDNDHQNDILAQFNDDPTSSMNDSTNLQDCIDALDSVIDQVPSYNMYNDYPFAGTIHDTSSDNTNHHHITTHQPGPITHQHINNTLRSDLTFDQHTLYNYSSLDCFIVHPELIHPQIHDPILHHHTSSTSLSYSLLDGFDVSSNDVERIMDSVVGGGDTINDIGDIVRKKDQFDRYFFTFSSIIMTYFQCFNYILAVIWFFML